MNTLKEKKLNKQNEELKFRLACQARELKIEACLEKVRAIAMGMKEPADMLRICKTISQQLKILGIKEIRNVQTAIIDEAKASYLNYEFFRLKKKTVITAVEYKKQKDVFAFVKKMLKDPDGFFTKTFKSTELKKWMQYQAKAGQYVDPQLYKVKSLYYYFYSIGPGALGVSTYAPLNKESIALFKRFRNVFQLAYQRFIDIQKAEAQAREAQIEAALEKIRSRSLAMHQSTELKDIIAVTFEKLKELNVLHGTVGIQLFDQQTMDSVAWVGTTLQDPQRINLPNDEQMMADENFLSDSWQAMINGVDIINKQYSLEQKNKYFGHAFAHNDLAQVPQAARDFLWQIQRHIVCLFPQKNSAFFVDSWDGQFYSNESMNVIRRAANVFEQAYIRFLDLQKAEAQVREAKIEAALERVRSRTMGMQKSEELKEVIQIVYEQFVHLNILVGHAGFIMDYKERDDMHIWLADPHEVPFQVTIPYFDCAHWNSFIEAKKTGSGFFANHLTFEEKNRFYQDLFKLFPLPDEAKEYYLTCPGLAISTVLLENVGLYIENFSGIPYTDEENAILMRFGKVFQQTYTRFLDLQKAEAQTRESQIQLALERVRARTMAMHKSDELSEVAALLFKQVDELGIKAWTTGFNVWSDDNNFYTDFITNPRGGFIEPYTIDAREYPVFSAVSEAKKRGDEFYVHFEEGEKLKETYRQLSKFGEKQFKKMLDGGFQFPAHQFEHFVFGSKVSLMFITYEPVPEAHDIFKRFGKVFEQTYTRFLDLKNAEAQAREAKIEAALERARTQSMIMQHSKELDDTLRVFHEQVLLLGIHSAFSFLWLPDEDKDRHIFWAAWAEDNSKVFRSKAINYPLDRNEPATAQCLVDWKSDQPVVSYHVLPEAVKNYFAAWQELIAGVEQLKPEYFKGGLYYVEAFMKYGCFGVMVKSELPDDEKKILYRLAIEFERAYTRFLDLQKAEAQARESQIELGLERVRAKAMAMQTSEELNALIGTVFTELTKLDLILTRCVILIYEGNEKGVRWWMANSEAPATPMNFFVKYANLPFFNEYLNGWHDRSLKWQYVLEDENKVKTDAFLFNETELSRLPDFVIAGMRAPQKVYLNASFNNFGNLTLASLDPLSDEHFEILFRFAKVFDLTYTRFNDLQKAEAQAREAQIELGLERVRAKAMAMHSTADLSEAVNIFFKELKTLGVTPMRCGVGEVDEEKQSSSMAYTTADKQGELFEILGTLKHEGHPVIENIFKHWKLQEEYHPVLQGPGINEYYRAIRSQVSLPEFPQYEKHYGNYFYFKEGFLFTWAEKELPEEGLRIARKFTSVLSLTYRRYKDLKEAEAQTKEAQIEAGLERVRSRTLAMHKSDELAETAAILFRQLIGLGIAPNRLYIGIIKDKSGDIEAWATDEQGGTVSTKFVLRSKNNASIKKMYDGWKAQKKTLTIDMQGKELEEYIHYLSEELHAPFTVGFTQHRRVQNLAYFSQGFIGIASPDPQPEETVRLLERFAAVFNLTYTRFNDLQIAEAQTHKANIEVALERVRARALAMQQPEELIEVAQVMRHEMGLLGVEELETSSIYIHDENSDMAECWYAIKDIRVPDKKLVADHFVLNLKDTWVGRQMFEFYNSQSKQISIPMQGVNRKEWIDYCSKQSKLLDGFYGEKIPDRTYHLYKFSNGTIGAATPGDISSESWELLQRAASVFSLAYSRFKDLTQARIDLQRLKEEKHRVETALTELKATQTQLIQAEKMASLGELTAGIAHEIQNPLNFVNNFSEVSNELIQEMLEEVQKGNYDVAKEIAEDVKQNLEKILNHGKRADGIVKGMLQHSRSSSGQKEPTDINALADEYLRLAYHGLRAKDKSFNAKFETYFDNNIGKINIIPQEIGRVILNLINNAFYAASQTPPPAGRGAEHIPTVWVSTRRDGDKVLISVRDNGPGIPSNIIDKIFQPFFTTKATGQGTGLGLSLSYDIVKAHGGEIKVETKEGEGSGFIILLPA